MTSGPEVLALGVFIDGPDHQVGAVFFAAGIIEALESIAVF
jgi:hypothetical protein